VQASKFHMLVCLHNRAQPARRAPIFPHVPRSLTLSVSGWLCMIQGLRDVIANHTGETLPDIPPPPQVEAYGTGVHES